MSKMIFGPLNKRRARGRELRPTPLSTVDAERATLAARGDAKFRKGGRRANSISAALAADSYARREVPITLPRLKFLEGDK